MAATAEQVLKVARAEIGVKESPANSNNVKYNTEYYGRTVNGSGYAWCAVFVWWVFKHAGCPELFFNGKKGAYVPSIADWGIAAKQTVSKGSGRPGDIVCYDFNHNRSSDHIGIIEKKNSDGSYTCIEGNTAIGNDGNGGCVMRRTRYQSQISYIIRPKYTASSTSTPTPPTTTNKITVDGDWGRDTTRKTQKVLGTTQDGIISKQLRSCKKYLQNANTSSWQFVAYSRTGSDVIRAIQKLVGAPIDGRAGKTTVTKMQKFLNSKGFDCGRADGYMGSKTVKAWQKYINSRLK